MCPWVLFGTLFSNWVPFWPSFFRKTPEKFKNYISLHSERAEGELRGRVVRDEALRPTGTPPPRCFFREEEFFIFNIKGDQKGPFFKRRRPNEDIKKKKKKKKSKTYPSIFLGIASAFSPEGRCSGMFVSTFFTYSP